MRGNIIEELHYGNIDPQDRGYSPKGALRRRRPTHWTTSRKSSPSSSRWQNKALFLRFCNAYAEFMGESELDTFITGFHLGARFMMDTFLSNDAPFESFLEG
ncbi:MAG: DUF6809 family protein [Hydrogeniiclostridium mannosilyticum]